MKSFSQRPGFTFHMPPTGRRGLTDHPTTSAQRPDMSKPPQLSCGSVFVSFAPPGDSLEQLPERMIRRFRSCRKTGASASNAAKPWIRRHPTLSRNYGPHPSKPSNPCGPDGNQAQHRISTRRIHRSIQRSRIRNWKNEQDRNRNSQRGQNENAGTSHGGRDGLLRCHHMNIKQNKCQVTQPLITHGDD